MKKNLILLLDEYPFNPGEYSFIKTELSFLLEEYNVSIISSSSSDEQKMVLDNRITLYHCKRRFDVKEKAISCFRFLFSIIGMKEILEILKEKQKISGRLYDSVSYLSCAKQLQRFLKDNHILNFEHEILVYSYWFNANCLAFLMEKKHNPRLKVISRVHGYDLYNERNVFGRQPFRSYMDKYIDKLFFVGELGKEYYINRWGDTGSSKYVVEPIGTTNGGVDMNRQKQDSIFRIVSCSHVIALKRVDLIVKALSEITDIEIEWTHFGTGELIEEIKRQGAQMLGRKKNIKYEFRGFTPVEEIMEYYKNNYIDCFLTTSSTEGCPVSIQEAMSYGVPVVATAVGEIPAMIQGNGILLPENPSPEAVCAGIRKLADSNLEEMLEMRKKSRNLWEERYNALNNAKRFVKGLG